MRPYLSTMVTLISGRTLLILRVLGA